MSKLSHFDDAGEARMVDVGAKAPTRREAEASAFVALSAANMRVRRSVCSVASRTASAASTVSTAEAALRELSDSSAFLTDTNIRTRA